MGVGCLVLVADDVRMNRQLLTRAVMYVRVLTIRFVAFRVGSLEIDTEVHVPSREEADAAADALNQTDPAEDPRPRGSGGPG